MFAIFRNPVINVLLCVLFLFCGLCYGQVEIDKSKYITVDEIEPGMEAYCLTVYQGNKIEKFGLKVLSVIHNFAPGRDAIMVQGTDERFIHTGSVAGCSGSPVYIDGRMAGALAFGWEFTKDPLYGVTPIAEMLRVEQGVDIQRPVGQVGFSFDFSQPIDFARINEQIKNSSFYSNDNSAGFKALRCPLVISGLGENVSRDLAKLVEPFGLMVVSGISGGSDSADDEDIKLVPGASLAVPLVSGDIDMSAIGTVTEVIGDKVYGFGHKFSYVGYGPMSFPMATGKVHTVVSRVDHSFKLASSVKIVGALEVNGSAAVFGRIGQEAALIPLTINVKSYNDPEKQTYNCQIVSNRFYTPLLLGSAVAGAAQMLGALPYDNTVGYKATIGLQGGKSIRMDNLSTDLGLREMVNEVTAVVAILMNNPYKEIQMTSLDFEIDLTAKSVRSRIWSVDLSDSQVKPGDTIEVRAVVETVKAGKKKYNYQLEIPENLAAGNYDIIVCGGYDYAKFLRKAASYRFIPENLPSLIDALNNLLAIKRDRLYCLLVLPTGGVAVEKAQLPDLPATKALILGDPKRTLKTSPYHRWIEQSHKTGVVVLDKKVMQIKVEK